MNVPASQRVLSIPELLAGILQHSSSRDNASNLIVCKAWFNEVLNNEWRVVDRADRLLGLLAPIAPGENEDAEDDEDMDDDSSEIRFTREIAREDVEKFKRYAGRVHALYIFPEQDFRPLFEVLSQVWPSFETGPMLPALRDFTGPLDVQTLQLLAPPSLHSLTLYKLDDDIELEALQFACSLIAASSDTLKSLDLSDISILADLQTIEPIVLSTFSVLRALRKLLIPSVWLTPGITDALAGLPDLHSVDAGGSGTTATPFETAMIFSERLDAEAFPSLRNLELRISFRRALSCFSHKLQFPKMKRLGLYSVTPESPPDYKRILEMVSRCFPGIFSLDIDIEGNDTVTLYHENHPSLYLGFDELSPILNLKALRYLSLDYPTPLQLDALQMKLICDTLKRLLSISLNPRPTFRSITTLHLSTLATLSNSTRHLRRIEIFVDTSSEEMAYPEDHEMRQLKGLEYLSLGRSALQGSVIDVSMFLSRVLPYSFNIGRSFSADDASWDEACSLIPNFMKAIRTGEDRAARRQQNKVAIQA
ncbi:hypothetical protein ONZ45_g13592 [Pleurotus djamor]|nr:hypothetical protein ONZ45_g13592 [Pleurotus djamor]